MCETISSTVVLFEHDIDKLKLTVETKIGCSLKKYENKVFQHTCTLSFSASCLFIFFFFRFQAICYLIDQTGIIIPRKTVP